MSKPKFVHEDKKSSLVDGKKEVHEEFIIDGDEGLFIKFFQQEGDKSEKITIKSKGSKFSMITSKGKDDKGKEEELTHDELVKELSKNNKMKFAIDYVRQK
jgi:hypothetical protein